MFRQILAALTGQSLSRLAARPADFWMKVKSRWRQNPGFVAAAAAGTIGIGLAIVLGIQGGLRLLDDPEPGDDVASDSSSTELGDPEGDLSGGVRNDLRDLFNEPEAPIGAARRPARAARSNDDLIVELDDEGDATSAPKTIASSAKSLQQKDPFDTDDASDVDERPVQIKPRSRHPLSDDSPDDEEEAQRKTVQLPVEADDEMAADESEVEPAKIAIKGAIGKAAPLESKSGPSLDDGEQDKTDTPESDEPAGLEIAETTDKDTDDKGTDDADQNTPGWKNQRSKSAAVEEDPPIVAQKSRAVETVIYSTPAAADASASNRSTQSAEEARPSRLLLEIAGPKSTRVGQICNFEIRVRNIGKTAVEKVTLSVELPAALVHEVAQSLEQQVGSLAPGRTYRALVRTQAKGGGRVTLKTDVAVRGHVETKSSATIEIGEGANATSGRPARR